MAELRDEIKNYLGVKTNDQGINDEINDLINACEADMIASGVNESVARYKRHPLTKQAQKFYAKAYFRNGDESGRFRGAYEALRNKLALGGGQ